MNQQAYPAPLNLYNQLKSLNLCVYILMWHSFCWDIVNPLNYPECKREVDLMTQIINQKKKKIMGLRKIKNTMSLIILMLFCFTLFTSRLFAEEYRHIYKFEEPQILSLPNGRQVLEIPGTRQKDDIVGAPILPVRTAKIFIPANEKVVSTEIGYGPLKTIEGSFVVQYATPPHPTAFKGPVTVDQPDPDIYDSDAVYPPAVYKIRKSQFLRGVQIVFIDLMPVLYHPAEGRLQYYGELDVKVITEKQQRPDDVMPFRNAFKDRKKILSTIDNGDDFLRRYPASQPLRPTGVSPITEGSSSTQGSRQYVVITTAAMAPAFQALTTYRASAAGGGYTTYIETIDTIDAVYSGIDLAEKMRNFIRDMYINYGTQYVVLGGDCDGPPEKQVIPTRGCYAQVGDVVDASIPSDLYFGCLDGSWNGDGDARWGETNDGVDGGDIDWSSEVYVGRIPADDTTEAMNQITKIIAFETDNRPNKILLVGEKLEDATWGGDRLDWLYDYMGSTAKTELYDRDWAHNTWPASQLLTYINSNAYYWIDHVGHSGESYNMKLYNDDILSMTNNRYFFVYSQGCYSGSMDNRTIKGTYGISDSFGEAITNRYSDTGAFAYIGNARYSWYRPGSYVQGGSSRAEKEFVEAIFTENITKLGEANQKSKTDLPLSSGMYRWIAFETNLIGDPATDLSVLSLSDAEYETSGGKDTQGDIVTVSGTVEFNGKPQCAMVLANGHPMFTCGEDLGEYDLEVPLDENGEITLFSFVDGLTPYRIVLTPDQANFFPIKMTVAPPDIPAMTLTFDKKENTGMQGWEEIGGTVTADGIPICAMILANGHHMFTCGENLGRFDVDVPLDDNDEITVFGFADGFQPFKKTLRP